MEKWLTSPLENIGICPGKGCTQWLWECRIQQLCFHPALTEPEVKVWKNTRHHHVPCPEAEVPVLLHFFLPHCSHNVLGWWYFNTGTSSLLELSPLRLYENIYS